MPRSKKREGVLQMIRGIETTTSPMPQPGASGCWDDADVVGAGTGGSYGDELWGTGCVAGGKRQRSLLTK